ncbi:MAG: PEP-CTERM sorting domain-containing protein [Phycisphaerae bacterium]|nr:PEP-CTERM sorting domain-containing protein [Phycisphaerae bacterium]
MRGSSRCPWLMLVVLSGFPLGGPWARTTAGDVVGGVAFLPEYWAGAGLNEAVLVVDFKATGGRAYTFGYRWDGPATGYDMITAVAAAGDLDFAADYWPGLGYAVDNITYRAEAGDAGLYWAYWLGTGDGGQIAWSEAATGMSGRTLASGDFDGWYNGFDNTRPRLPEPATALLLGAACVLLRLRARRS